jgi:lipopolysaccharide/colanic/teichoic acid biosynthesis glycosyltransferase
MLEAPRTFYATKAKRVVDFVGSLVLLLITAPIHAICAAAVVKDDGRPVYFHQSRAGKDGRVFQLHKLRTMTVDGERIHGESRRV